MAERLFADVLAKEQSQSETVEENQRLSQKTLSVRLNKLNSLKRQ